jgi:hypothetical protein
MYHFAVFEFNDFNPSVQYLTVNPSTGSATTLGVLPVTFISFSGENKGNNILLHWSTAQESNGSHFEVQRVPHGDVLNATAIHLVNAAGQSSTRKDYYFTDKTPYEGINYYRVKQVDKDGRFMFSGIITVKYEPKGMIRSLLNPVHSAIIVELIGFNPNSNAVNVWRLYDLHGKLVVTGKINSNVIYGQLPSLPAALYLLEIQLGDKKELVKIVKH